MTKAPRFYTTGITAEQRAGKLLELFSKHSGLVDSFHVMNEGGAVAAVAVQIQGVGYRFAPSVGGVRRRMDDAGVLDRASTASPEAVAWAQLYTLLEMQLEMIASGVANVEDVLGGWALVGGGRSVGDMIRERKAELMPGEQLLIAGPS